MSDYLIPSVEALLHSRYGDVFRSTVISTYVSDAPIAVGVSYAMDAIGEVKWRESKKELGLISEIRKDLASGDAKRQALAAMMVAHAAYESSPAAPSFLRETKRQADVEDARRAFARLPIELLPLLMDTRRCLHRNAAWADAWLGSHGWVSEDLARLVLPRLCELWHSSPDENVRHFAAFAISELPLLERDKAPVPAASTSMIEWLVEEYEHTHEFSDEMPRRSALVLAYYWKQPWSDEDLVQRIDSLPIRPELAWRRRMLRALGRSRPASRAKRRVAAQRIR